MENGKEAEHKPGSETAEMGSIVSGAAFHLDERSKFVAKLLEIAWLFALFSFTQIEIVESESVNLLCFAVLVLYLKIILGEPRYQLFSVESSHSFSAVLAKKLHQRGNYSAQQSQVEQRFFGFHLAWGPAGRKN